MNTLVYIRVKAAPPENGDELSKLQRFTSWFEGKVMTPANCHEHKWLQEISGGPHGEYFCQTFQLHPHLIYIRFNLRSILFVFAKKTDKNVLKGELLKGLRAIEAT